MGLLLSTWWPGGLPRQNTTLLLLASVPLPLPLLPLRLLLAVPESLPAVVLSGRMTSKQASRPPAVSRLAINEPLAMYVDCSRKGGQR